MPQVQMSCIHLSDVQGAQASILSQESLCHMTSGREGREHRDTLWSHSNPVHVCSRNLCVESSGPTGKNTGRDLSGRLGKGKEKEVRRVMAAVFAVCNGVGRKSWVTAAVRFTDRGTHAALWRRGCSQYKQVTNNEDLPIPMENPYQEPLKKCILCEKRVDYKNVRLLSQFISPFTGCIYGRHLTGLCGKKQKEVAKAIKRAQKLGFMPVMYKDPAYLTDPKVCNIRYRE
ncbi:28S ribosomal protein S18c, mitochondrial [Sigmodon hispidus]